VVCVVWCVATATTWPTCVTRNDSGTGPSWSIYPCCRWVRLCVVMWHVAVCLFFLGVFVTREHVRHNKSGIAHRGRTGINH
jgi:hypothetical protein